MIGLANPTRFLELAGRAIPWLAAAALILLGIGLYLAFFVAPPDYQQGETVRIMFVHVPAAWLAMPAASSSRRIMRPPRLLVGPGGRPTTSRPKRRRAG